MARVRDDQSDRQWELLLHEFDQAWEHYRHAESQRMQYIGSFLLALFAFGPAVGATTALDIATGSRVLAIEGVIIAYLLLAVATLFAIDRSNAVLDHYSNVWHRIRRRVYDANYDELQASSTYGDPLNSIERRSGSHDSACSWLEARL